MLNVCQYRETLEVQWSVGTASCGFKNVDSIANVD